MRRDARGSLGLSVAACLASFSCAGRTEVRSSGRPTSTEPRSAPEEPDDGLEVSNLMGSLSPMLVESTMAGALETLGACYAPVGAEQPFIRGTVTLSFRVDRQGQVRWVFPSTSDLGHRCVETCLVERAQGIRFPRPRGGEAEFSYPLTLDPGGSGRPAEVLGPTWAAALLRQRAMEWATSCTGDGPVVITVYVEPGGRVASAGASYPGPAAAARATCLATAISGFLFPDPGSWVSKTSLEFE